MTLLSADRKTGAQPFWARALAGALLSRTSRRLCANGINLSDENPLLDKFESMADGRCLYADIAAG